METAVIRRNPTDDDLARIGEAARLAIEEMANANSAAGADAVQRAYLKRIYEAVVSGEVEPQLGFGMQ